MSVVDIHPVSASDAAERQILGAALLAGPRVLDDCADLRPEDFYQPHHEELWKLFHWMRGRGEHIDAISVAEHLIARKHRVLTRAYLHQLVTDCMTPGTSAVLQSMGIVRRASVRRQLQTVANQILQGALDTDDPDELIQNALADLERVTGSSRGVALTTLDEAIDGAIARITDPARQTPTPWPELNNYIGGFQPGRVYVIGARPGSGKSIFGLQCATTLMLRFKQDVAMSSLEMDREEMAQRAISALGGVDFKRLTSNELDESGWAKVAQAQSTLTNLPAKAYVDDRVSVRPADVRAHAKQVAKHGNLGMIVVDYLQLMEGGGRASDNRQNEIASFSRAMKVMAKTLHVPVLLLSQLNRGPESRQGGAPKLSDLRESGAIEQDADVVLLLHRDIENDPDVLQVHVAKNRQGPLGQLQLRWQGQYMRVVTW